MSLREHPFIRTHKNEGIKKPHVSFYNDCFRFNSTFVKESELRKYNRVKVYVDEENYQVGFEFHNDESDSNSRTLQFGQNTASIKASEIFNKIGFLKKIEQQANLDDRRFPVKFDKAEKLYVINLRPSFEQEETNTNINKIPRNISGIYRYLRDDQIVYIGKGRIRDRLDSPERKNWEFDEIQYSIVNDENKCTEWETYWIDKYKKDNKGKLPIYNKIEGVSSTSNDLNKI